MEKTPKIEKVIIEKTEIKSLAIIGLLFAVAFLMLAFSNLFS